MGATGYTIFEDDLGADWTAGFLKNPSVEAVRQILNKAGSTAYLDDRAATAALCCSEIVAAGLENPVHTMPDDLYAWAQTVAGGLAPIKDYAYNIIEEVQENSELSGIWAEDPEWIVYLQDLKNRLC